MRGVVVEGGRAGVGSKGTTPPVRRAGGRRREGGEGVMHAWCVDLGQKKITHDSPSHQPLSLSLVSLLLASRATHSHHSWRLLGLLLLLRHDGRRRTV